MLEDIDVVGDIYVVLERLDKVRDMFRRQSVCRRNG